MTTMRVVGECFFWYRLTRVFPDKFHRAVKRLCVCVCVCVSVSTQSIHLNGQNEVLFAQKCIRLVHEKLRIFQYGQYIVGIYVSLAF